jgi:hypothetical protein
MNGLRTNAGLLAVLLLCACSGTGGAKTTDPNTARDVQVSRQDSPPLLVREDASALFAKVEEALLASPDLQLRAQLNAEGALQAALDAKLRVSNEQSELAIKGSFGGQPVDTQLTASGDKLQVGKGRPLTRPAALREALVLGFTRMGLMHNAARLSGSGIPDHAHGGVRNWLQTKEHALEADAVVNGAKARVLTFAIFVEGERSGEAKLWIDAATLRPLERAVVVHFPQGDMTVTERYQYQGT